MKVVILNVGVGGWHPKGSRRLSASIVTQGRDIKTWTNEYPLDCPPHAEANYAFKPYAFKWAMEQGYDIAIWMDSAVWAKKSIDPLIEIIQKQGHLLFKNGWTASDWLCDNQLECLNLTREEAKTLPHMMANVMGFDLNNPMSKNFLDAWIIYANCFSGEWTNTGKCSQDTTVLGSRHDQAFASVISHKLGMEWSDPNGLISYNVNEDSILVTQGM